MRPPARLRAWWRRALLETRRRGPLWLIGQVLLTAISAWLIWTIGRGALGWALAGARWEVVSSNLRLFAVGRYPETPTGIALGPILLGDPSGSALWRPAAAMAVLAAAIGMADSLAGRRAGVARLTAAALLVPLALPVFAPLLETVSPQVADLLAAFGAGRARLLRAPAALAAGWLAGLALRPRLLRGRGGERRAGRAALAVGSVGVIAAFVVLAGIGPYLEAVPSSRWGGLLLTLVLAGASIVLSFPLGVLLALGRRSGLPLVRALSVSYIELIRGVPLITVLYMASLMLPLVLGETLRPPDVLKAIAGLTAFSAAYVAEDVRGGLAAVGLGQYDAARALGLGGFGLYRLVVLPQALRTAVPAIVGQFISLFKDTSLVIIIGLREMLGTARTVASQGEHIGLFREALVFIALVYFAFSLTMSRRSRRLELPDDDPGTGARSEVGAGSRAGLETAGGRV